MTPLTVAAVWAGAGVAGAALLPVLKLRRLALLIPLAGLGVVLTVSLATAAVPVAGPTGSFGLDRVAQGLIAAAAGAVAATLLLGPVVDAAQMRTMGLAAAATVVALASSNAIVWAVALVGSLSVLALRWISIAPGRATFAAGRVAIPGAAAFIGAAAFLPIVGLLTGPRPVLVSGLLACGAAAVVGLLPLGGWSIGVLSAVPATDVVVWALLVAPGVLLGALRLEPQFPPLALVYFLGILTVLGLASALWQAILALRVDGRSRYARILLADLALTAAAIGTGHAAQALPALLLLTAVHMVAAPLLLQHDASSARQRRLVWLLLCGLPPAPSFWGRLAIVEALSVATFWGMVVALAVDGMLFVAVVLTLLRPDSFQSADASAAARAAQAGAPSRGGVALRDMTAWCLVAGGLVAGLAPGAVLTVVFGVR